MSKRRITYLLVLMSFFTAIPAFAGTDLLSNALTQSNSFLKEAGLVQKKYSGIARKYLTGKVSINVDKLGGERVEKCKEKAENFKEKAEGIQERLESAKEKKEALQAKFTALNEKAAEYQSKASEYMEESKKIYEKYKTYERKIEDKIDDIKDKFNEVEEAVSDIKGAKSSETVLNGDEGEAEIPAEESAEEVVENTGETEQVIKLKNPSTPPVLKKEIKLENKMPAYNQADAIRSASAMATETVVPDLAATLPEIEMSGIGATDVFEAAAEKKDNIPAAEVSSPYSLEEQLVKSVAKTAVQKKNNSISGAASAADLINIKTSVSERNGFNSVSEKALQKAEKTVAGEKSDVK